MSLLALCATWAGAQALTAVGNPRMLRPDATAVAVNVAAREPVDPAIPAPASTLGSGESVQSAEETPEGGLPPLQGHQGPELYTIPVPENEAVAAFTTALRAGNLDWMRGALDRAALYRGYIVSLLERYRLPYELLFLPVVESEYRPWAISGSGAAGIWQFMANSVAGYNIRIDDMVDERRDFWKASDAALRKLEDNYLHFGDWLLALAAYNCGRGAMDRIIAQTGIADFWTLRDGGHLPPETARYIVKFLGALRISAYPGRYGLEPSWDGTVVWERVALDKSVNIELLAAVTGTPAALLERGNAELHYPVTPTSQGGYWLKVPGEYRDRIEAALLDPSIALMRYDIHTIRTGDTLYALALRYGITADLIERHNVGVDAQRLTIGAKLFIPLLGEPQEEERIASEPPPPALTATYTVQKGDTLWSISRGRAVAVEDLAAGNGIGVDSVIRPGDVLKVPDISAIMAGDE